jgi:NAD-dependent deacetylase
MKKKIVIFSGAGLDRESGVLTFRDCKDGLWNNHRIEDVATIDAWKKDREKVLDFYNERRQQMPEVHPNNAHKSLVSLEETFDVTNVTQNVSDLLERAGATKVFHLHGELTMACDCMTKKNKYYIGYNDIVMGTKCPETDSQLRPDIVWFGEYPMHVERAYQVMEKADILIIIGTSLQIGYTLDMLRAVKEGCRIIYIDPSPMKYLDNYGLSVEYIKKGAVEGVAEIVNELINK